MSNPFGEETDEACVYEGEFRLGTGRDVCLWIQAEQKYVELFIGGHEIMDMPDTPRGLELFAADLETIREHLLKAQKAIQSRLDGMTAGAGS